MQRTYRRRRPRPEHPEHPHKRRKVYVEITSPRKNTSDVSPSTPDSQRRPARTGSIIKRMHGRTRTQASPVDEPAPLARHASTHSLPTSFPDREPTPEPATQSSLPSRNIRTYAGSSRSFLVALPVPDADPLKDDTEPHESYTDLRTRWGIDLSEDDPQPPQDEQARVSTPLNRNPSDASQSSLPGGMLNDLKSITELRSKGESRRFLDEVGYLFEGLESSSAIGLRRASALEVVNKLCDVDFNRRAKTSDFYTRTWNKFWAARAGTSDRVFDATLAFFAALAARDPQTLLEVAQQKDFIPTLMDILASVDHRKDVLAVATSLDIELKSYGIMHTEGVALKLLASLVSKESPPSIANQPSTRFFISHSLAKLPPSLLTEDHLPMVLANLRAELDLLGPRIAAYESGLPLFPPTAANPGSIPSLCHIEACLRLLDSYLLGHWSSPELIDQPSSGLSHLDGFTSELLSLCILSASFSAESEVDMDIARKCLCSALRILTLLSHDDLWWCDAALDTPHTLPFVAMTAMRSQEKWSASRNTESSQTSVEAFDLLCLALGLVMNWATLSPRVAHRSKTTWINPTCPGTRHCIRSCRCLDQTSILDCVATLHSTYSHSHADDPPECAFLRGYTAILVGLLIQDDPSSQTGVLPGESPPERMRALVGHCRAFLELYNDADESESPRATPEGGFGRRAAWDQRGDEIARGVIGTLERWCTM